MRAVPGIFLSILLLVGANVAAAQTTQAADLIRRDAASGPATAAKASGPSAARVALSLGAVLVLILALFLVGRRFLPRAAFSQHPGGAVQVLARTAISPKQRVILLQVGRRILVVADGGQNLSTLCEITQADEAAVLIAQLQSEKPGGSFTATLNGAMEKFRASDDDAGPESKPGEPLPDLDSMRQEIDGLAQRVRRMAR